MALSSGYLVGGYRGVASASSPHFLHSLGGSQVHRGLLGSPDGTDDDRETTETQKINQTSQQPTESHLTAPEVTSFSLNTCESECLPASVWGKRLAADLWLTSVLSHNVV